MRILLAAILLFCGCGRITPTERLDRLFDAATDDLHAGELAKALLAADQGIAVAGSRHDLVYQWKYRLLRCEIMLHSHRAEEVLNQLRDALPATPEFAVLAARKAMLEAWALLTLGRAEEADTRFDAAHQAAEAARAEDVLLEIESFQGRRLMSRERYDDAESAFRSALRRARALHSAYSEAGAQVNLGMQPHASDSGTMKRFRTS